MKKLKFSNRAQIGEYVSGNSYFFGLLRIVQCLFLDLSDLLESEGRRFGIVLSYLDSVYNICTRITISPLDDSISSKIVYLYKPIIIIEFKKLCKKHISKADVVIALIKKILDTIINSDVEFSARREVKSLLKIINKLYDNIRNKSKTYNFPILTEYMENYIPQGLVGKYELEKFSLLEEENKRVKKPFEGSGVRIKEEYSKVLEVTWKEE